NRELLAEVEDVAIEVEEADAVCAGSPVAERRFAAEEAVGRLLDRQVQQAVGEARHVGAANPDRRARRIKARCRSDVAHAAPQCPNRRVARWSRVRTMWRMSSGFGAGFGCGFCGAGGAPSPGAVGASVTTVKLSMITPMPVLPLLVASGFSRTRSVASGFSRTRSVASGFSRTRFVASGFSRTRDGQPY